MIDAHTIEVGNKQFTAQNILIATGGTAVVPAVVGHEHVVTSDSMFDLTPFPKRLLVVGGQEYQFSDFCPVIVVGEGKASAPMAAAVEEFLVRRGHRHRPL